MFLSKGINNLFSVHVSFASVLLKTDAWSGTFRPVTWLRLQQDLKHVVH